MKTIRLILAIIFASLYINNMCAQTDSVTTLLHEVSVIGVKQRAQTDIAATTDVSGELLRKLNATSVKSVSEIAPNFYMPQYGSRMTSSVYVRGIGARTEQSAVGLNVDGVPFLSKDNYDFDMLDISRIEVFRGPQAVLNGRNAIGGQVNVYTLSPWDFQGVRAEAEYGRFNAVNVGAGWYGLLCPSLATAITARYYRTDGAYVNQYNGKKADKEQSGNARWKLSWHPASSRFTATNTLAMNITRQGGYAYEQVGTGRIAYNDTCFYRRNSVSDALTLGWAGRRVVVNSVTSFQYIDDNMTLDQDFTPKSYFTLTQKRHEWAFTEDLFTKGHRGNYKWLGGVFGFYRRSNMKAPVTFKNDGISELIEAKPNSLNPSYPIVWDEREFVLGSDFLTRTRGFALYHRSELRLGDFLLEGGLRWDVENVSMDYWSHSHTGYTIYHVVGGNAPMEQYAHVPVDIDDSDRLSHTYNEILPKVAASWQPKAGLLKRLYMSASKGYKAGGYNTQMFSDVLQQRIMNLMGLSQSYKIDDIVRYKPEKSWNFEVGARLATADGKLSVDATVFYVLCSNLQLTMFPSGNTTGRITTNAGRSRNVGTELSVMWKPCSKFTFRADYGYTNAEFVRYFNGIADYRGNRVPYAPENTVFMSADYMPDNFKVFGADFSANVNLRGIGSIYWNEGNTLTQPFYVTVGASVALAKEKWQLRLWGENITNTRYNTFYFVSMSREFVNRAMPWTLGATLRLTLGL